MDAVRRAGTIAAVLCLLGAAAAPAAADTSGPELAVAGTLLRADGAVTDGTALTVDPIATDPDGVRSVELKVDGRLVRSTRRSGPSAAWRIAPADYGDGPHRVVVTATDAAGNTTTEQADVRFAHAAAAPPEVLAAGGGGTITVPGEAHAVANVGDVDGDGSEDVLVGAGRGAAYLLRGDRTRLQFRGGGEAVAAGGDVNGDGYRDLLIGARSKVYVVFGGPRLHSLDLGRLGRDGLTIDAPGAVLATRRLGDFAVDGDLDGDGLDDIAIGARDATFVVFGRRDGGTVRAVHRIAGAGASVAFPGDIDHDGRGDLLLVAPAANTAYVVYGRADRNLSTGNGFRVLGAPGDALATAAPIGDVDGDSTPDLLLGGRRAAVVFAQPGADVDLAGAFAGFRVDPPPGAGTAQVMGTGDLDGDYAPDAAFGFPDVGAGYLVYSPLDQPRVDLANLPGERGTRIAGPRGTGRALDGLDAFGAGEPAALIGAPGSLTIVPSPSLAGSAGPVAGCQPNRLWTFPLSLEHVLPRCRRADRVVDSPAFNPSPDAGQIARFNPEPACGTPSRTCLPTAYRSGNARLHGPQVGLTTDAIVDLVDSYGERLAAIQRAGADCFTVFDRTLTRVGATCDPTGDPPAAHAMEVWVQGRACMATAALEDSHYLVRLLDPAGAPAAAYRELQGFVRRDQLTLGSEQTTVGGATYDPQQLAEAAYTGCGPQPPKRRPVPIAFTPTFPGLPTGERLFGFADRYVSNQSFEVCEGEPPPPDLDPACYGPYANYQVPTLASKDPQLETGDPRAGADWAALTVSTTGASGAGYASHPGDGQELEAAGGGFVRAIVPRDHPFTALDGFAYSDPNVPCDTLRIARWLYGVAEPHRPGERRIFGWTAFRDPQTRRERNGLSPGCP